VQAVSAFSDKPEGRLSLVALRTACGWRWAPAAARRGALDPASYVSEAEAVRRLAPPPPNSVCVVAESSLLGRGGSDDDSGPGRGRAAEAEMAALAAAVAVQAQAGCGAPPPPRDPRDAPPRPGLPYFVSGAIGPHDYANPPRARAGSS